MIGTIMAAKAARSKALNGTTNTFEASLGRPAEMIDEITELLRLEDENRDLRKELCEKLRAENVDLKNRLNLA